MENLTITNKAPKNAPTLSAELIEKGNRYVLGYRNESEGEGMYLATPQMLATAVDVKGKPFKI